MHEWTYLYGEARAREGGSDGHNRLACVDAYLELALEARVEGTRDDRVGTGLL